MYKLSLLALFSMRGTIDVINEYNDDNFESGMCISKKKTIAE